MKALLDLLRRWRRYWPIPAALLALLLVGCSSAAWRTTAAVRSAGGIVDKSIRTAVDIEAEKCVKAGQGSADALPVCVRKSRAWAAHTKWRAVGVPAVNSAILATIEALLIAERVKSKVDWIAILKPAACALSKIVAEWADLMGSAAGPVRVAVAAVKGGTCE